jgi:4-amino-4-deoxy-L-arabinose transferase-like glycosyltransferase
MKKFLRKEYFFLVLILILAAFMRLYRISDYMTFLGDEGRDVLTVYGILHGDLVFLGPRSSAADFFYGPIYFYFITPFLWLFNYDPVGPAIAVALLGIATVFLIYYVCKKFFNEKVGLFASALYAVSPLVINYSHSSWNPNPMPFVSLLLIFCLYKAVDNKSLKYFLVTGVLFGVAMQLQYIAMFLAAIIFFFTIIGSYVKEKKIAVLELLKAYAAIALGFGLGVSMFLAFEIKNGFPNTRTIVNFMLHGTNEQKNATVELFQNIPSVFFQLFSRLLTSFPPPEQIERYDPGTILIWQIITIALATIGIVALVRTKNMLAKVIILCWLVLGIFLFGFYRKVVFDYYLGFLFPLPFIIVGLGIAMLFDEKRWHKIGKPIAILLFLILFIYNLSGMPFRYEPNRQKNQIKTIAEFVLSKTEGKPFNFALITPGNSDHGYRYYFLINGKSPVTIENVANDPERKTVTDQLLVVCEAACEPLGNPLFEVAGFGRAEIEGEWPVSVVKVYKLKHYPGEGSNMKASP